MSNPGNYTTSSSDSGSQHSYTSADVAARHPHAARKALSLDVRKALKDLARRADQR